MPEFHFRLAIPAHEYLTHYQGVARNVVVTLASGVNLQFPASALRAHVSHEGVYGQFVLRVDENNKLQALERLGD
jgi:hypothetical protein